MRYACVMILMLAGCVEDGSYVAVQSVPVVRVNQWTALCENGNTAACYAAGGFQPHDGTHHQSNTITIRTN